MVSELIVGYDLRTSFSKPRIDTGGAVPESENLCDRQLRIDVCKPLSVSPDIWPRYMEDLWWDPAEISFEYSTMLPSRFEEVAALVELLQAWSDCLPIAISVGGDPRRINRMFGDQWHTEPRFPREEWQLLGYDVAERSSLRSALASFGWGRDFWTVARPRWATSVNAYNLFDNVATAQEYCEFAEDQSIDHGPFFTYGLWLPAPA